MKKTMMVVLMAMVMFLTLTFNVSAEVKSMVGVWHRNGSKDIPLITFKADGTWTGGQTVPDKYYKGTYTFDGKRFKLWNNGYKDVHIDGNVTHGVTKEGRPTIDVIVKVVDGEKYGYSFTFLTMKPKTKDLTGLWWWKTAPTGNSYTLIEFHKDGKTWHWPGENIRGTYTFDQ